MQCLEDQAIEQKASSAAEWSSDRAKLFSQLVEWDTQSEELQKSITLVQKLNKSASADEDECRNKFHVETEEYKSTVRDLQAKLETRDEDQKQIVMGMQTRTDQ